jgi:hypothetical protein
MECDPMLSLTPFLQYDGLDNPDAHALKLNRGESAVLAWDCKRDLSLATKTVSMPPGDMSGERHSAACDQGTMGPAGGACD